MKILVVDDFPTMRRIVTSLLKELGCEHLEEAEDGDVALEKIKGGDFGFVITDWHMPNMSGIDLLKAIRQTDGIDKTPVLMITAEAKKEQIVAAAQAGANGYILKPFDAVKLKEKIDKIFAE